MSHNCDISDVVPDVGRRLIYRQTQGSLKTADRHVVLVRVETAQTQVVEQLRVVQTHLQQSPVNRGVQFLTDKIAGISLMKSDVYVTIQYETHFMQ